MEANDVYANYSHTYQFTDDEVASLNQWASGIIKNIREDETIMDQIMGFINVITWKQPFIIGIFVFHIIFFILMIVTRHNWKCQCVVFITSYLLVYNASRINTWCFHHWESFSDQNYFDPSGLFIGVIFCIPIFVIAFIALVLGLKQTATLLIQVKRLERKHELSKLSKRSKNKTKTKTKAKIKTDTDDTSNGKNNSTNRKNKNGKNNKNSNSNKNNKNNKKQANNKIKSKASKKKD